MWVMVCMEGKWEFVPPYFSRMSPHRTAIRSLIASAINTDFKKTKVCCKRERSMRKGQLPGYTEQWRCFFMPRLSKKTSHHRPPFRLHCCLILLVFVTALVCVFKVVQSWYYSVSVSVCMNRVLFSPEEPIPNSVPPSATGGTVRRITWFMTQHRTEIKHISAQCKKELWQYGCTGR